MADRSWKRDMGTIETGVVKLYGVLTFGASGAISSSTCRGFSVAKTGSEAGRYTVTLEDKYNRLLALSAIIEGAADSAFTATGLIPALRNVDVASKTLDVQLIEADGNLADTDPASGDKLYLEITLKNSTLDY